MTKAELTIIQYLENIETLLETILKCIEHKEISEPLITFKAASDKASDSFIIERTKEIFNSLNNKEGD